MRNKSRHRKPPGPRPACTALHGASALGEVDLRKWQAVQREAAEAQQRVQAAEERTTQVEFCFFGFVCVG